MISGKILESDYLAALYLHQRSTLYRRWAIGVAALATLAGLLYWIDVGLSVGIATGLVLGVAIGALSRRFYLPIRVRKLYLQQKSFQYELQARWNEDHLEFISPLGQGRRPWGDYLKVHADDKVILLYHSDVLFDMLPRHWFADAAEAEALLNLARAKIGA